jgi:hypothetical protein
LSIITRQPGKARGVFAFARAGFETGQITRDKNRAIRYTNLVEACRVKEDQLKIS